MEQYIIIPSALIGLMTTLLVEILKLVPALRASDNRKKLVCLVASVVLVVGFMYTENQLALENIDQFFAQLVIVITVSYSIYKSFLQRVEEIALGRFKRKKVEA